MDGLAGQLVRGTAAILAIIGGLGLGMMVIDFMDGGTDVNLVMFLALWCMMVVAWILGKVGGV